MPHQMSLHKNTSLLQDLKGLTLTKMERYCLVIAAFEANLAEYELLKKDLAQVKRSKLT